MLTRRTLRVGALGAVVVSMLSLALPANGLGAPTGSKSARAGSRLWQVQVSPGEVLPRAVDRRYVYVGVSDGPFRVRELVALRRKDGAVQWRVPVSSSSGVGVQRVRDVVVVSGSVVDGRPSVLLLDAQSGRLRARVDIGFLCGVAAGRVIVATDMIRAYDLRTGHLVWRAAFSPYPCSVTGRFVVAHKAPGDVRIFDARSGQMLLHRNDNSELLVGVRPSGHLVVCKDDVITGLDIRTGQPRWQLPWTCDIDEGTSDSKVLSTEPLQTVRLADSDSGRLLAEAKISDVVPGWGVLREFTYVFNGRYWLFSGERPGCVATTRAFGPSLTSPEVPGYGLTVVNRTILLTRQVPAPNGCRIVGVDAFAANGTPLWSQALDNQRVGNWPLVDNDPYGTATTLVAGSARGEVTAVAL